jgi:hypothetical protein
MKKSRTIILLFILLTALGLYAQEGREGHVTVYQDPLVDTLLSRYREVQAQVLSNPDNKGIPGYRIQIFFDSGANSGSRARYIQFEFQVRFPDVPAYVTWKAPNYRVRVGDFRTRLEAEHFLQQILKDYPDAWVIKDEINFPKLY